MHRQGRRFAAVAAAVVLLALTGCGTRQVTPSTYAGSPDSPDVVLLVEASEDARIAEARVTQEDDQQVVVEVRLDGSAEGKDATIEVLEAEVRLDKPLGGRQVVDQEGRAIPES